MRSGQQEDLEFVLSHIDDVDTVPWLATGEFVDATRQYARVQLTAAESVAQSAQIQ